MAGENVDQEDSEGNPVSFSPASLTPSVDMISKDDMLLDTDDSSSCDHMQLVTSMTPQSSLTSLGELIHYSSQTGLFL